MGEKVKAFGKLPQILTFPFKGEGWFGKLAIAAGVMLAAGIIPILPTIILLGYFYEMVRRIIVEGEDASLPEWNDWGGYLSNGFKWFLSTLVVILPFIVVFIVMMALNFIPIFFLNSEGGEAMMGVYFGLMFIVQFILIFASMIFMVFMGVFAPVYMTHLVAEGELKAMFQIKQWWKIFTKGFWEFLVSFLLMYGLGMIIYFIFFILLYSVVCCCLAPFFIAFGAVYLMAVYFALIASAYRDGREKMPVETAPKLDAGPVAVEPEASSEPEPVEEPELVEEFDIPSPDMEGKVEVALEDATVIAVEVVEEVAEGDPSMDATMVSGANEDVAAAMGFAESTVKMDNLKKIDGVGPKTAGILNQNGILTFGQLAETPVEKLKEILSANGLERFTSGAEDWIKQAKDLL